MAMRAQAKYEVVAIDALDRRLACGIDLGNENRIGIVETGAEILEQRLQAGIAMRLHHGDDFAVIGIARGFEHSSDLHGVMAVVIDAGEPVPSAAPREAPLPPAEGSHRLADR